ncbi:MAG: hypothetical protein KatS3mg016_1641 [Fimbriimonadales bacterium]|nr:MAG: hypothetical protein KatS3mg016_1641 [Fimbriimonadales bacterium]
MRLGKFLAIGTLATLATSALAQFGVYGSDANLNTGFVAGIE